MKTALRWGMWLLVGFAVTNTWTDFIPVPHWVSAIILYVIILGFAWYSDDLKADNERLKRIERLYFAKDK